MTQIAIVRTDARMPDAKTLDAARGFMFGVVDGFREPDKRSWRRFWNRLLKLEPGEFFNLEVVFPRSGPYHRRHMKIEASVFDAQERFEDFEQFRYWLKVGAGWVTWAAGPKGGVVPIPKSISYAKADEAEFREFHAQAMGFLRGQHAAKYLWPHLKDKADDMMDSILEGFGE